MLNQTTFRNARPTIGFFVGTTGTKIGEMFEKMRGTLPEKEQRLLEFFMIDSDKPETENYARTRHYYYSDLFNFLGETHRGFYEGRYPENMGTPLPDSSNGNGVTRIFGASSLVNCIEDLRKVLADSHKRMKRSAGEMARRPQVFITFGMGGTGAGMALDIAAMTKDFYKSTCGQNPAVYLHILAPDILINDPDIHITDFNQNRMRALTYAFLKEVNHFAEGNPFISSYRTTDRQIEIKNRDGDLLVDGTYFYNGSGDIAEGTPDLKEAMWNIAETQFHLAATEIGRRVGEILPNQREELLRAYPVDFNHSDFRGDLTAEKKERLRHLSRRTWLSGARVRNVRFAGPEIADYFRQRFCEQALGALLQRSPNREDTRAQQVEEMDRFLGIGLFASEGDGLLTEWGLSENSISERIGGFLNERMEELPSPRRNGHSDQILRQASEMAAQIENSLEELTLSGPNRTPSEVAALLGGIERDLLDGFRESGAIRERLDRLCFSPSDGQGLIYADHLVAHLIEYLREKEAEGVSPESPARIRERVEALADQCRRRQSECEKERASVGGKMRRLWRKALQTQNATPYSERLSGKVGRLVPLANQVREAAETFLGAHLSAALRARVYQSARESFVAYRRNVLLPALKVVREARRMAESRREIAKKALERYQGDGWESPTTIQLGGDSGTLSAMERRLPDEDWVRDHTLEPFSRAGLINGRDRLRPCDLGRAKPTFVFSMVEAHLRRNLANDLAFLEEGWRLPEVAPLLETCARHLDAAAGPLLNFDRSGVPAKPQSWLIVPKDLELPDPFGRRVNTVTRLEARDALTVSVVSVIYGVPPNALAGMHDYFHEYGQHIGDHKAGNADLDRYPLHVFREAPLYNEPHSPVGLDFDEGGLERLLDLARKAGLINGDPTIQLNIRSFPANVPEWARQSRYQNGVIELCELLIRKMMRTQPNGAFSMPDELKQKTGTGANGNGHRDWPSILVEQGLAPLARLYEQRVSMN